MAGVSLGNGVSSLVALGKVKKTPKYVMPIMIYNNENRSISLLWFYCNTEMVVVKLTLSYDDFKKAVVDAYKLERPNNDSKVTWNGMQMNNNVIYACSVDDQSLMSFDLE